METKFHKKLHIFIVNGFFVLSALLIGKLTLAKAQVSEISIGAYVEIITDGQRLNLRLEPGLNKQIVAKLDNGTTMLVIGGPREVDGYFWWEIEGGVDRGWAASNFLRVVEDVSNSEELLATPTHSITVFVNGPDSQPLADTYGFKNLCFRGWDFNLTSNTFPVNIDFVQTYKQAKDANDWLKKAGYASNYHTNSSTTDTITRLSDDIVFFFYGHGNNYHVFYHDDKCNYSTLPVENMETNSAPDLKLSLLLGCETGLDTNDPNNVMVQFVRVGSNKVIGFSRKMHMWEINAWLPLFWKYSIEDKMEVEEAAIRAIEGARPFGFYNINPSALVILGNQDVYLIPEEAVTQTNWWQEISEAAREKWENYLQELQRKLIELIEQQAQSLTQKLIVVFLSFILSALKNMCAAPIGFMAVLAIPAYFHRLKNQKRF